MPQNQRIHVDYQFGAELKQTLLFRAANAGERYATTILRNLDADPYKMFDRRGAEVRPGAETIWSDADQRIVTTLLEAGFNPGVILDVGILMRLPKRCAQR